MQIECKCGSQEVFLQEKGSQVGAYCKKCGKWIKWVSKNERRVIEHNAVEQEKPEKKTISHDEYVELDGLLYVHWIDLSHEDAEAIKKVINDAVEREGE